MSFRACGVEHLHDEEGRSPCCRRHRAPDVRMIERGRRARFALKTLDGNWILGELARKELDGDLATESGVLGPVDDTHAALANLLNQAIVSNGLANHSITKPRW